MRIGIIGAGQIGSTLGRLWCEAGHEVRFGTPHPQRLVPLTTELGPRASAGTPVEAADFGETVLLAVPSYAIPMLGTNLMFLFEGKPVLDATNPSPERDGGVAEEALATPHGSSAWTAEKLPYARVVKAFNMQRFTTLRSDAHRVIDPLAIVLAGDDQDALVVAQRLVIDAGFEPVIVGELAEGRAYEPGTPGYANDVRAADLRDALSH